MTLEQGTLAGDVAKDIPLLELRGIGKDFVLGRGIFSRYVKRNRSLVAVADVDLAVRRGSVLGLVGESGSGKSTLAEIAVLLQRPTSGDIVYAGEIVTQVRGKELRDYRQHAQLIFQDSGSALNRRKTIRRVLAEALALRGLPSASRPIESEALLASVGLAAETLDRYPHQLSGGQRQRVGIARALAMRPELLVADEPVSALDVSLQAQILNLMMDLRRDLDLTMIFISHDLAVVGMLSTELAVMYAGRIVEQGDPRNVLRHAAHPYTQALIAATPTGHKRARNGSPRPNVVQRTAIGCPFVDRCPLAMPVCREQPAPMTWVSINHRAACHRL